MGLTTKEVTTEYVYDEDKQELIISKQKVTEKTIPPNVDIIKLLYSNSTSKESRFDALTDEELEREKQRLLSILKEGNSGSRENSRKAKV